MEEDAQVRARSKAMVWVYHVESLRITGADDTLERRTQVEDMAII